MPHPMQPELEGQMTDGNDLIRRVDALAAIMDDPVATVQHITALPAVPVQSSGAKPLTAEALADALSCFWNAALSEAHNQQEGFPLASIMACGFAAVEIRLREFAAIEPAPIDWRCDDTRPLDVPRMDRGCDHGRDRPVVKPEPPTEPPAKPEEPEEPTEPQKPGFEPSREQDPEGHKAWKDAVADWEKATGKDWTPPERVE